MSTIRRTQRALLVLALALAWPVSPAVAATEAPAGLDEAYRLFSDGKLPAARRLLRETLATARAPAVLARAHVYLGLIAAAEGDRATAAAMLRQALRHDPELQLDPEQLKPDFIDLFRRVRDESTAALAVRSQPTGAHVAVDGVARGRTPLERRVFFGTHLVELRDDAGAVVFRRQVALAAGKRVAVDAVLAAPRAAPPPATTTYPAATAPQRRRVWTWVAVGLAGAALAAAVTLSALAQSAHDDGCAIADPLGQQDCHAAADRRPTAGEAARYSALRDDLARYRLGANVLWSVTGALAAATVVAALVEGRAASAAPRRSRPRARVGLQSIGLGFAF